MKKIVYVFSLLSCLSCAESINGMDLREIIPAAMDLGRIIPAAEANDVSGVQSVISEGGILNQEEALKILIAASANNAIDVVKFFVGRALSFYILC